jgi:small subunit ribosomal protein S17
VETANQKIKVTKKKLTGEVVSDKMTKTIVVKVSSRQLHGLYKKYLTKSKRYKAHDENGEARIGDRVRIIESRPISKDKRWRLLDIVEKAK